LSPESTANQSVAPNYRYWAENGAHWVAEYNERKKTMPYYHIQEMMLADYFERCGSVKVLEFGCGVGRHLSYLRNLPQVEIFGYDQSPAMVEAIRQSAGKAWFEERVKVGAPLGPLPYPDNFFDVVFSSEVLVHVRPPDLPVILQELMRVAKWHVLHLEPSLRTYVHPMAHDGCWSHNLVESYLKLGRECVMLPSGFLSQTLYRVALANDRPLPEQSPVMISLWRRAEADLAQGIQRAQNITRDKENEAAQLREMIRQKDLALEKQRAMLGPPSLDDPDPEKKRLRGRIKDMLFELEFIKSRASYQIPRRFRRWRLYSALRFIKHRENLLSIRSLDNQKNPNSKGEEIWLLSARYAENEPSIPWDYVAARGNWRMMARKQGPQAKAMVGSRGTLRFMLHGEDPVIELLRHPWSGKAEITYGNRTETIDLYAAETHPISIYPARQNWLIDEAMSEEVMDAKTGAPAMIGKSIAFEPHEQEWLESMQKAKPRAIALHVPRWLGITSSTKTLFEHTLAFPWQPVAPYNVDQNEIRRYAHLLLESGVGHVISSGGDAIHFQLCSYLKQLKPSIRCDLLWHGTYVQFSEDYNWQILQQWINGSHEGLIHTLATVKKGQELFFNKLGCRSAFLMNYVPEIPEAASMPDEGGPHLGIWLSGDSYRKLPHAMLSAARMIPGAVIHGSNFSTRTREVLNYLELPTGELSDVALDQEQMLEAMQRTHLSLYVTFAECTPMLPLESLSVGVPCLLGRTSHLFEDHDYLTRRLVVPAPDRADVIVEYIERAIEEREMIVKAYSQYAPQYNNRARQSVRAFLESD